MRRTGLCAMLVLLASAGSAAAQTLSGITLDPVTAKPGEPVRITVTFDNAESPNCNVRLHFGDKQFKDHKINQTKDVPLRSTHVYEAAGSYTVKAEGKTALPMLKCVGANQTAVLTVAAPRAEVACPAGWRLDAKSTESARGAFTCTARPGTALPATRPACTAPLVAFADRTRGQLGCRA